MSTQQTNEEVIVTLRQSGATATVRSITSVREAIEATELAALQMSETLDNVFDVRSLAAYEARVSSLGEELRSMSSIQSPLSDSGSLSSVLQEIAENTRLTANYTQGSYSNLKEMAELAREAATATDDIADDSRDISRNTDAAADNLDDIADSARVAADELRAAREETERLNDSEARAAAARRRNQDINSNNRSGGGSSARGLSSMLSQAGALTTAYAFVAANVYAASEAFRILSEAASDDRLLTISTTLSAAKGTNVEVAAEKMRGILDDSISFTESINLATAAIAKGFTTSQLEDLTQVARRASVALGLDLTDAMNRVTKGIAKQEVELLDELGITIKLTEAFDAYALEIGSTADELSSYQRQQALTNLVLKRSEETLGSIDDVMSSTEWEKFGASVSTQMNKSMQSISGAESVLTRFIGTWNTWRQGQNMIDPQDTMDKLLGTVEMAKAGQDLISESRATAELMGATSAEGLSAALLKNTNEVDQVYEKTERLRKVADSLSWTDQRKGAINAQVVALESLLTELVAAGATINKLRKEAVDPTSIIPGSSELAKYTSDALNGVDPKKVEAANAVFLELEATAKATSGAYDLMRKSGKPTIEQLEEFSNKAGEFLTVTSKTAGAAADMGGSQAKLNKTMKTAITLSGQFNSQVGSGTDEQLKSLQDRVEAVDDYVTAMKATKGLELVDVQEQASKGSSADAFDLEIAGIERRKAALSAEYTARKAYLNDDKRTVGEVSAYKLSLGKLEAQELQVRTSKALADSALWSNKVLDDVKYRGDAVGLAEKQLEIAQKLTEELRNQGAITATTNDAERAQALAAQAVVDAKSAEKRAGEDTAIGFAGGTLGSGTGLQAGEQEEMLNASNIAAGSAAMSELLSMTPGLDSFAAGLSNIGAAALTMGDSMERNMAIAGGALQAVGGMMEMVSQAAITEIDHQITMEQNRDGQSEESLAKIKALNIKKIKEEKKAAKQSIIISTAMAVMNALATPPFPLGIALAAGAAITGAMALSQANSSASNQLAELNASDTSTTTSNITVGERVNSVDVSQSASQGEYAFVTGENGTGTTANNFTTRASGAFATANTSFIAGEFGPEKITPATDAMVTPNEGSTGGGTSGGGAQEVTFNISAMDAQSIIDRSADIFAAFSLEASQQGMSLSSLSS